MTGSFFQLGALSALENVVETSPNDVLIGTSSGASVAAAVACGLPVSRLFRAVLDPADNYFRIERSHFLNLDLNEWRRTIESAVSSIRHGMASLIARTPAPMPDDIWVQLDRLFDVLPAGLLSLDRYERFLADFFLRRRVPNSFRSLERKLFITATDLDSGELVLFGSQSQDHVPISLACVASMAQPLFFSPVRVGGRYYIDGGVAPTTEIDIAVAQGADLIVVLNPNVPIRVSALPDGVPTGYGIRPSLRDKGLMWVYNQAMRTSIHARIAEAAARINAEGRAHVLLVEPDPDIAVRFVNNASNREARRDIMHASYRAVRAKLLAWASEHPELVSAHGWQCKSEDEPDTGDSAENQR